MRLTKAQIQNFRSFVDSGQVNIERNVTAIVGKNEQGKSNFLNAIESFNKGSDYKPRDLPKHLASDLQTRDPDEIPVVTLWFDITPKSRKELAEVVKTRNDIKSIKCTKFYSNNYKYWYVTKTGREILLDVLPPEYLPNTIKSIKQKLRKARGLLKSHAEREKNFGPSAAEAEAVISEFTNKPFERARELIAEIVILSNDFGSLQNQDSLIKNDILALVADISIEKKELENLTALESEDALDHIIPNFILHSTRVDFIPDEVTISEFVSAPDDHSRGMANLCRAVGLSFDELQQISTMEAFVERETHEDHYRGQISGPINKFWRQQKYEISFRFEAGKFGISISDQSYPTRMAPSERSDGFQWLLSFYAKLRSDQSDGSPNIILLDNPAVDLHIDGQRDIMKFLEATISKSSQVIYVTHSPGLIDAFGLEKVRKIFMDGQKGSRVTHLFHRESSSGKSDILEPVRLAIGASMISSLVANQYNLLVEGVSDKAILEATFAQDEDRVAINGPLSGGALIASFYDTNNLPFIALLDADGGGRTIRKSLKDAKIKDENIVDLRQIFPERGPKDFEIEDIISEDFYYSAVKEEYGDLEIEKPEAGLRNARAYKKIFKSRNSGQQFSKRRVAGKLKQLILEKKIDGETEANFKKIRAFLLQHFVLITEQVE